MKIFARLTSLLLILAIFVSAICINTSASVAVPTIRNMGTRHVVCTSLSDYANKYYIGDNVYETLSAQSDEDLFASLHKLMKNTHTGKSNYDECRDLPSYMDCQNGDGTVVLLYSSYVATTEQWAGSNGKGWNREHVWPQSLGGFKTSGAGSDLHHVRPADAKINSTRNNCKYGNVEGGSAAPGVITTASGGERSGEVFEPLDNVKGDVARICLYVYARYGTEITECSSITNVFESVDVLLEWCALDPVDTWEMGRNDVVGSVQGNRNVFIDYPEYAWLIFDKEVPTDMQTPSGKALASKPAETETQKSDDTTGNSSNNNSSNSTSKPSETKKTDKATDSSSSSGCASSVSISAICFVGIVGIMAVVKKKED